MYYRYKKSFKPDLPAEGDRLYLDGYPRSGNTYFTTAIKYIYPDIAFSNHLHVIAPIKIALNRNVPTFLLMRTPEEAVASYLLHVTDLRSSSSKAAWGAKDLCQALVQEWIDYYQYVSEVIERVHLISADLAFTRPELALKQIITMSELPGIPDLDDRLASFHQHFKRHDSSKPQGSTSFPDPSREQKKDKARRLFRECPLLDQCHEIYERLKEAIVNV